MKKWNRLGALCLAVAMTLSLLPGAAFAAERELPEVPLGEEAASAEAPQTSGGADLLAGEITVNVPAEDITLIAAKATWTAVSGATGYTVTITSPTHSGLTDNVWYQDNDARTVKLANLHPGTQYTVTVTAQGATGSGTATFTTGLATNALADAARADAEAPDPYGALPDDRQLYYHDNDMAAFIHFGPNTFTGLSWGTGNESPSDFNLLPGELTDDPAYGERQIPVFVDQWVKEIQDAGFQRLIMVAKHHDGFCLWDSQYTTHDVMESPYGRDLLEDVSAACTKYDMDMGFYFSPWDRHDSSYGQGDAYNEYYINQLREVLGDRKYGNHGVFVETWMDGAKGDNTTQEYDFDTWFKVIHELQPTCLIYTDRADGGVRWSGNEVGSTGANPEGTGPGDMCWQTMDPVTANYEGVDTPGILSPSKKNKWLRQRGGEDGVIWSVCECDVSIESEWFWHNGNSVRGMEALVDMYLTSVGYGSPFLMNVPPSTNGYFRSTTSQRLAELGAAIRDSFKTDLAAGKTVTASATRTSASGSKFAAANLTDNDPNNYWTMDDGQTTGSVVVELGSLQRFDMVTIKEFIALGQRIRGGKVEYLDKDGAWQEFGTFTTVGAKRIVRSVPVQGTAIRVTITDSKAVPVLKSVEVYKATAAMEQKNAIPEGFTYIDDRNSAFTYSGNWANGTDGYEGTTKGGETANNSVSGSFSGTMFYLIGVTDTKHGDVKIEIDAGTDHAVTTTVSSYATSRHKQAILYTSPTLSEGTHTVKFTRVNGWFEFDGIFYLPAGKSMVEFEQESYQTFPDSDLELKIVRSGNADSAITLKINDFPGTAVQGAHYEPVQKIITMDAGQTETTVVFTTLHGTQGNEAIGKDYTAAITECSDPNVILGAHATAAIYILDPDSVPQQPKGESFSSRDPFHLPTQIGKTRRLEAEYMELDSAGSAAGQHIRINDDSAASGGRKVGWFENGNKAYLYYDAPQIGTYTVTLRYQSGRPEGNLNKVNWRGDNVEDMSATIPGTGDSGNNYGEHSYTLNVTTAGPGMLEFYAETSCCPNIDYIDFRLDETVSWNLALGQGVGASYDGSATTTNKVAPSLAVDGITNKTEQWNSADMKTSTTTESDDQTPQWLWVDLGATGSKVDRIKLWYNMKVWPMVYEIQTSDTPDNDGPWETVVRVERRPFDGAVKNGEGQNIADETGNATPNTAANTDTITATSSPALETTTLKRYVRFYVEKVNTAAGGHNVNLREIEIYGTNPDRHPPVDVAALLATATDATIDASGRQVTLPSAPGGATLAVAGSELANVVHDDGTIGGRNIGAREVKLLVRAWDNDAPDAYQQKNLTVTVPDHKSSYPAAWFPAVTSPNPKPEVIPAVQEWYGYTGSFTLSADSRIIYNDAAGVGLDKVAANMKADLLEITGLDLTAQAGASGGAADIYIESLTDDRYDLGDEGYLLRTSGEGVKIYAPTYTGCIFGTITVEQILWQAADHLSVPMGVMRDYPAYAIRGLKVDVGRAPTRYQFLQDYAKIMLWYKMSEYDLHINDTENPNASNATDSKNNIGFHRLESDTFPSLKLMDGVKKAGVDATLVDADYYNDPDGYGGNPVYTKEQWKALTQLTEDYGMHLLTEIDMPGHALAYNKYVERHLDEIPEELGITGPIRSTDTTNFKAIELMDLTGANAENALKFAKALWDEYTSDGTITGDVVHIGMDEYWLDGTAVKNAFANFANELREVVQDNLGAGTKVRMWGATSGKFSTAPTALGMTHKQLAEHFELEIWDVSADDPVARARDGYKIVNCEQSALYSCPGRHQRDVPNAEYVYNSWDPTMFGTNGSRRLLYGDPTLLGAKAVMWGEQTQEGLTERDINQRLLRAVSVISEKTWGGQSQGQTFSDFELRANRLAEGPGTQIAMEVPSQTALVLDYDFKNAIGSTVYDGSGNGYNATLTGGAVDANGWLTFDGSTLLTTRLKTLSYPYTVSFDLKTTGGNTAASSLFSGYDGRIQVAGKDGHISANACSFIRDFGYTVPTNGQAVNITLVGTFQATRLYVNGQLVKFLSQTGDTFQDGVAAGAITSYFSSVPLPLEKIGDGLHGSMANLKVYNKAFSADEVAALVSGTGDDGLVNVAQGSVAGGSSYHSGDGFDQKPNAHQRTAIAAKAVDGEGEEMYSFWQADHNDSTLTVDMGERHPISRIDLQWKGTAPGYTLQTSLDGKNWTVFTQGTAVNARFVKLSVTGAGSLAELLAYEAVDKTALTEVLTQAEAVVAEKSLSFASTGANKTLFDAVVQARAAASNPLSTNVEVSRAVRQLQPLLEPELPPVEVNTKALVSAIVAARAAKDSVVVDTDPANVPTDKKFVFPLHMEAFVAAISDANVALVDPDKTDASVAAAVTALNAAKAIFVTAWTQGTKTTGGGGGSSGGGSYTPPASNTDTEADGTKVTTVTKPDGTVTETTQTPDGTKAVVETKPDGSSTRTVEQSDGTKSQAATTADGAVTITVTDADGEELAKVELPAAIPDSAETFEDLDSVPWAQEAIQNAAALELVKGTGGNKYEPAAPMTRGALATVLHRLSNGKTDYRQTFKDVAEGQYYTEGVAWAAKVNVVKGVSEDVFAPDNIITREQLAVMLARYAKLIGLDTRANANRLEVFADSDKTGEWAVDGVAWCVQKGILKGKGGNALDPTAQVSRAEVAVMLDRFLDLVK